MATNRLFLFCRQCQDEIPIAQFAVDAGAWSPAAAVAEPRYADWLTTHTHDYGLDVELSTENQRFIRDRSAPHTG